LISQIFSPKNGRKSGVFTQNTAGLFKIFIIGFQEKRHFSAENW
jgi:hypothetical protein